MFGAATHRQRHGIDRPGAQESSLERIYGALEDSLLDALVRWSARGRRIYDPQAGFLQRRHARDQLDNRRRRHAQSEVIRLAGPFVADMFLTGIFAGVVAIVFRDGGKIRTNDCLPTPQRPHLSRIGIYVGVTTPLPRPSLRVLASAFSSRPREEKTVGIGFIGVLWPSTSSATRRQSGASGTSTVGKAFALSAFIVGGLWVITQHVNSLRNGVVGAQRDPVLVRRPPKLASRSMALATIVALYAFTGFDDRERRRRNGRAGAEPAELYHRDLIEFSLIYLLT